MERLRIVVGEDEPELLADLTEMLQDIGHEVVASAENGRVLIEACREQLPDLVITDIKMPDMDGLEAAAKISESRPTPFVITSAYHDPEFIQRALKQQVLAYLVKPINEETLKTSIDLARHRFQEFKVLQEQAVNLQQALEERKLIERAKGILMKRAGLDEPAAFRRLQLFSSQRNMKMAEVARTIVEAEEVFEA